MGQQIVGGPGTKPVGVIDVADSYDNALAETVNGLYKAEVIWRRGPWKTGESVELATMEWVSWFNHQRLSHGVWNLSQHVA